MTAANICGLFALRIGLDLPFCGLADNLHTVAVKTFIRSIYDATRTIYNHLHIDN